MIIKMKVYILYYSSYDGAKLLGAYTSEEKADSKLAFLVDTKKYHARDLCVECLDLD